MKPIKWIKPKIWIQLETKDEHNSYYKVYNEITHNLVIVVLFIMLGVNNKNNNYIST